MREYDRVDDENGFRAGVIGVIVIAAVMYGWILEIIITYKGV